MVCNPDSVYQVLKLDEWKPSENARLMLSSGSSLSKSNFNEEDAAFRVASTRVLHSFAAGDAPWLRSRLTRRSSAFSSLTASFSALCKSSVLGSPALKSASMI